MYVFAYNQLSYNKTHGIFLPRIKMPHAGNMLSAGLVVTTSVGEFCDEEKNVPNSSDTFL